ncbi:hypothetical protein ACFOWA_19970 [Pedobacter lithocola]|uniref:Uncharacterized protein n=1 Tax=Pedobacter lithocola TaxID=1908239 RepID=A0ABV8PIF7_9SPHI
MKWKTPGGTTTEDAVTGYPIEGAPGEDKETPCRFHLDSTKEFKNEDGTVSRQVGSVRLDANIELPLVGQAIEIPGYFSGPVRGVYAGQLSSRLEV